MKTYFSLLIFVTSLLVVTFSVQQSCMAQFPAYWSGGGDGTSWFDSGNWSDIVVPTGRAIFSNENGDPFFAGVPNVTNPIAQSWTMQSIELRSADVAIDFNGQSMELNEVLVGGPGDGSFCQLELQNISLIASSAILIGTPTSPATLIVDDGAIVITDAMGVGSNSSLELAGGAISLPNDPLNNFGTLSGKGDIVGLIDNMVDGRISLAAGDTLMLEGFVAGNNQGAIDLIGGQLIVFDATTNATDALITGRDSILRFENGLTNQGGVGFSFGTMDVFGDIDNQMTGTIVVTGNSQATFYDDVINNGEFRVSSGSTAVVFGDFSGTNGVTGGGEVFLEGDLRPGNSPAQAFFESDVVLTFNSNTEMELGGTEIGTEYDSIDVTGTFEIDGDLNVALIDGFKPLAGDTFELIRADILDGSFRNISLPKLDPGLRWQIEQDGTRLQVTVAAIIFGDVNLDGVVNLLDIDPFINRLSTGTYQAEADINQDGVVNLLDIDPFIAILGGG